MRIRREQLWSRVIPTHIIGPENIVFYARMASVWPRFPHSRNGANDNNRIKTRDQAIGEQVAELFHCERAVRVLGGIRAKDATLNLQTNTRPSYR